VARATIRTARTATRSSLRREDGLLTRRLSTDDDPDRLLSGSHQRLFDGRGRCVFVTGRHQRVTPFDRPSSRGGVRASQADACLGRRRGPNANARDDHHQDGKSGPVGGRLSCTRLSVANCAKRCWSAERPAHVARTHASRSAWLGEENGRRRGHAGRVRRRASACGGCYFGSTEWDGSRHRRHLLPRWQGLPAACPPANTRAQRRVLTRRSFSPKGRSSRIFVVSVLLLATGCSWQQVGTRSDSASSLPQSVRPPAWLVAIVGAYAPDNDLFPALRCSGVLVSARIVLTARHCLLTRPDRYDVVGGMALCSPHPGDRVHVTGALVSQDLGPDVVLLKLSDRLLEATPARLGPAPMSGDLATTAGFGQTPDGRRSCRPRPATLRVSGRAECDRQLTGVGLEPRGYWCAFPSPGSRNTCLGDSGAGVETSGRVAGLVSSGPSCAANVIGFYSALQNAQQTLIGLGWWDRPRRR